RDPRSGPPAWPPPVALAELAGPGCGLGPLAGSGPMPARSEPNRAGYSARPAPPPALADQAGRGFFLDRYVY
ncbi:MAG: hypothetical protein V1797_11985, partial [Pseudomonadota bacterium]